MKQGQAREEVLPIWAQEQVTWVPIEVVILYGRQSGSSESKAKMQSQDAAPGTGHLKSERSSHPARTHSS